MSIRRGYRRGCLAEGYVGGHGAAGGAGERLAQDVDAVRRVAT